MIVRVNGTDLWFDVDGPALVPEGGTMRRRPTVVLLHGGPGSFDHYYFKPDFERLAEVAQVIYLDLRDHGRSARGNPDDWSYEICADDVRAFCDILGIERPIVHGHSLGGFIAITYAIRHPGHPAALVLDSTAGRFHIPRMVENFRKIAGDDAATVVQRVYGGGPVTADEWAPVWRRFGRSLPDRSYGAPNADLNTRYVPLMGRFDVLERLRAIACPTLVVSGAQDPAITPEVSRELFAALPSAHGRLEVIEGAGHFPWKDAPERYWPVVTRFVAEAQCR